MPHRKRDPGAASAADQGRLTASLYRSFFLPVCLSACLPVFRPKAVKVVFQALSQGRDLLQKAQRKIKSYVYHAL